MFEGAAWWALVVCFVWLVAMNLATLFKVALTDPGIVPRQQPPPGASDFSWPPAFKDVVIDGRPVQLKFCDTCYLYRPLRTIHCSVCNNCVTGLHGPPYTACQKLQSPFRASTDFDHHCPWIGNCVGVCCCLPHHTTPLVLTFLTSHNAHRGETTTTSLCS